VFDLPLPGTLDEAFAMVHPEDLENVKGVCEQAIRNPGEFEIEYRSVNRPSTDEFWIHSAGVVIADAGGVPTRIEQRYRDRAVRAWPLHSTVLCGRSG